MIIEHTFRPSRFTVSSGSFTATVPARSAIAIHTGQKGTGSGSGGSGDVTINFAENATTTFGEVREHPFLPHSGNVC